MKNKKNVIIISMLVAIVVMIVGYAAFSASLKINGIANIESNWEILFTNIEIVNKTNGATETILPEVTGTSATFGVNLKLPGDYIEYKITVENRGTMGAIVENINASETGNDAFTFEITNIAKGDKLAKESSTTFNVKVSFDENATSIPIDPKNKLTLEITYIQDLGQDIDSEDVIINSATLTTLSGNTTLSLVNSAGRKLTNYTISGNSVQNGDPTPDTPIEIESVGDKTKNLFNIMNVTSNMITYDYIEYLEDYSGFVMKNSRFANGIPIAKLSDLCPELKVGDTFVFNFETNAIRNNTPVTYFYLDVYGATIMKGTKYVCTQEMLDSRVHPYSGSTENAYIKNIQFELGETVTDYEPYGKYKIPVEVSGKNLFDVTKIKNGNIKISDDGKKLTMPVNTSGNGYTNTTTTLSVLCPDLKVGDVAVVSFNTTSQKNVGIYLNGPKIMWKSGTTLTITQEMLDSGVVLYGNNVTNGETEQVIITNLQIELGEVVTEYEPYVEPTTYNIYLDEPLRKIGEYADYIDFENKKVIRKVAEKIFTGNETIGTYVFGLYIEVLHTQTEGLSSHFEYSSEQLANSNKFSTSVNKYAFHFFVSYTVNEFKEWLKIQHDNGTPLKIYYVLETPIEEIVELPTIRTNEGTSIISIKLDNGVSVPISVEYYKMD